MAKPELLAPAGDMECLETAVRFGADAVYIGGPMLQLRADSVGFTKEGVAEAAAYAHAHGVKLYVTVNCFARNEEIDAANEYAKFLYEAGVDAVIVSHSCKYPSELHKLQFRAGLPFHGRGAGGARPRNDP